METGKALEVVHKMAKTLYREEGRILTDTPGETEDALDTVEDLIVNNFDQEEPSKVPRSGNKEYLKWYPTVNPDNVRRVLGELTIIDKIEASGITREEVRDRIEHLRNKQVPNRTVLKDMDDEDVVFYWFKNWLHPALKTLTPASPRDKRGCGAEVLLKDQERDMLRFYENGQQNFDYTMADIEAWLNENENYEQG